MKIGMCGMGKLGMPVALAIESKGHDVLGYDVSDAPYEQIANRAIPHKEEGLQPLLDKTNITMVRELGELATCDIIFLPVQTPHDSRFEGTTRLPEDRADFDYTYLQEAVESLSEYTGTLAVISTCLPGTYDKYIKDIPRKSRYVYTPQFIAMGTVLEDYLNPEFNLIGVESEEAADQLERFYATINNAPNIRTDITTAEGIKVSYNTWITAKTVIANAWGEMAERTGMDFDAIKRAWDVSGRRLWSPRYTNAGKSDGGGCHPRDNIALSWLASEVGASHNIWEDLMKAREDYEDWHARLAMKASIEAELPLVLLGKSFKPETNIATGSPAVLMANMLKDDYGYPFQHYEDAPDGILHPAVYFIATQHERYKEIRFPRGSIVIDVFGYLEPQDGVIIERIGRNKNGRDPNTGNTETEHTSNS